MKPKIGAHVVRADATEPRGVIIAVAGDSVKVYWGNHTTTWTDVRGLVFTKNPRKSRRSFPKPKPDVSENRAAERM